MTQKVKWLPTEQSLVIFKVLQQNTVSQIQSYFLQPLWPRFWYFSTLLYLPSLRFIPLWIEPRMLLFLHWHSLTLNTWLDLSHKFIACLSNITYPSIQKSVHNHIEKILNLFLNLQKNIHLAICPFKKDGLGTKYKYSTQTTRSVVGKLHSCMLPYRSGNAPSNRIKYFDEKGQFSV